MKDLLNTLLPVLLLMAGTFATVAFVFIRSNARVVAKFLLVPAAFAAAAAVPVFLIGLLGHSVPLPLPDKVVVLAHRTIIKDNKKDKIEIWIAEKDGTRLHITPWSKPLEKQLEEIANGRERGLRGQLSRVPKGNPNDSDESDFALELLTPEQQNPKGPNGEDVDRLELPPTEIRPEPDLLKPDPKGPKWI